MTGLEEQELPPGFTRPRPLADLYLRLSDLRNKEALDGREARLRARAADSAGPSTS